MHFESTLTVECARCGTVFAVPNKYRQQNRTYCSRGCARRALAEVQRAGRTANCRTCGKEFDGSGRGRKTPRVYCSRQCWNKRLLPSLEERFWSKVRKTDDCWIWTASANPDGYGHIVIDGKKRRATHIAWELACGPVPEGAWLLHRCDNPTCVRPDHLFLGDAIENMRDRVLKGRDSPVKATGNQSGSRLHPESRPRGDAHWKRNTSVRYKLTKDDVRTIRALAETQTLTFKEIGVRYGVSGPQVGCIVRRKCWPDVV